MKPLNKIAALGVLMCAMALPVQAAASTLFGGVAEESPDSRGQGDR